MSQGMLHESVGIEEILYRDVPEKSINYKFASGKWRVTSAAFGDRQRETSLFRHILCENPPFSNPPRLGVYDAVYILTVSEIIKDVSIEFYTGVGQSKKQITWAASVDPDTSNGQHISHVVVRTNPAVASGSQFDRIKEALADIANRSEPAIPPRKEYLDSLKKQGIY